MEERHVPLSTVAGRLGVSERTVRRWIQAGKLKATRPGRDYRISESAVKALIEEGEVSPKAESSSPEPSLFNGTDDEQSSVIADYERLIREHRIAWRDALEALAAPWADRIAAGAFDRSMVEQFFTDVAAISQSVSRALRATVEEETTVRRKYKAAPTADDVNEMWATAISPAGARLLEVSEQVYAAALERFSESELEMVRRKRDEARRAFANAA